MNFKKEMLNCDRQINFIGGQFMRNVRRKSLENIPEKEIIESLIYNYRRKLAIYRLIDEKMKKKYGMEFEEFEKRNVVKEKNFSWEVESDAMEWEHVIAGIKYLEKKLTEFEKYES